MRNEIVPKNILMIGSTGVGKTEVARRLAKLVGEPFIKVEATEYTEVGYVGRDVESMIRDLVESSVRMVKEDAMQEVQGKAEERANKKLIKLIVPSRNKKNTNKNPFDFFMNANAQEENADEAGNTEENDTVFQKRQQTKKLLELGELEDQKVTVEVDEQTASMFDMLQGSG